MKKYFMDFMYEVKDNEAVIYKYTGDSEEVTIPSSIEGFPVTDINGSLIGDSGLSRAGTLKKVVIPEGVREVAMFSFSQSPSLESVFIPSTVTEELEESVFFGSRSLVNISVDENNPKYADIDGILFNKDKTELVYFPMGKAYETGSDLPEGKMRCLSYTIPDGVTTIANGAFKDSWLCGVTIPNTVTKIDWNAFNGCSFLEEITLPEGITEIARDTFKGCDSLTSITIPESVTKVGSSAFQGCDALENIVLPANVVEIGPGAFRGCTSLTSITLPEGITRIASQVFADCISLTSIHIPAAVERVDVSAFQGCKALENITVDENNSVFTSVERSLYDKDKNTLIYSPHGLRLKRANRITNLADLVGMTDEELLAEISAEVGLPYTLEPDDGWKCASSMFEWVGERGMASFKGINIGIQAFTSNGRITKLSLAGLDVTQLPLAVAGLLELTVLDISHTWIKVLPEWVCTLLNLEVLNVYSTPMCALPASVGNLANLKELHLGASDITELPESIGNLSNLEVLHLNHTRISKLPETIGKLTALKSMNLHGSRIEYLPESIGDCTALECLFSYYMPLQELPESIGNLSALKRFWICQTNVSKLPESICNLTALVDFQYYSTNVKELPEALCNILDIDVDDTKEGGDDGNEPGIFISIRTVKYDAPS